MKDVPREQFRWAPHVSGMANARPKDYAPAEAIDAENEYVAWALARNSDRPLQVGDMLETPAGELRLCKYVGFEEARWLVAEPPSPNIPAQTSPHAAHA